MRFSWDSFPERKQVTIAIGPSWKMM